MRIIAELATASSSRSVRSIEAAALPTGAALVDADDGLLQHAIAGRGDCRLYQLWLCVEYGARLLESRLAA